MSEGWDRPSIPVSEFARALKYANGVQSYANEIIKQWNDGNRPDRRRLVAALRAARGPAMLALIEILPDEIISKLW